MHDVMELFIIRLHDVMELSRILFFFFLNNLIMCKLVAARVS